MYSPDEVTMAKFYDVPVWWMEAAEIAKAQPGRVSPQRTRRWHWQIAIGKTKNQTLPLMMLIALIYADRACSFATSRVLRTESPKFLCVLCGELLGFSPRIPL